MKQIQMVCKVEWFKMYSTFAQIVHITAIVYIEFLCLGSSKRGPCDE